MTATKVTTIHGVLMSVFGTGVLIVGKSGIGKSDLALVLLGRGHALIADDVIEFSVTSEKQLLGRPPQLLKKLLEIRGMGVIDVATLFGPQAVVAEQVLSLVVTLDKTTPLSKISRDITAQPECNAWELLEVSVPSFFLPLSEARPADVLLETLVRQYQHAQKDQDANQIFLKNHQRKLSVSV